MMSCSTAVDRQLVVALADSPILNRRLFLQLRNTSGREVVVRCQGREGGDALAEIHSLMSSDVLVLADSSFSFTAALLSNATVLAPACGSRRLLPQSRRRDSNPLRAAAD